MAGMIPFLDLQQRHASLADAAEAAVQRVVRSGVYILGPEVEAFERAFGAWLGGGEAVGVANGTDAVTLALMALGIGPGDEVLTVANTCMPTVSGILACGAVPRLMDCDPATQLAGVAQIEARLTADTRAVVGVHLYGLAYDAAAVRDLCRRRGIAFVEDCAQAHGTLWQGQKVGTFADAAAFSFYPTKNLGAYGDGGLVFTRDRGCADRLRLLRMYGYAERDSSVMEGRNSRLDEIQAALLGVQLRHLDGWLARRRAIAARYTAGLAQVRGVTLPAIVPGATPSWHLFTMLVEDRQAVRDALQERGVGTAVHYPLPIHRHPVYAGRPQEALPGAEWSCGHTLSLPCHPHLGDADVEAVIAAVAAVCR